MIALAIAEEVQRLLDEGSLSQRKIALRLGVSRGTVNAIARGKRRNNRDGREETVEWAFAEGVPKRCPECGAMVQMPCLACGVRQLSERRRPGRCKPDG